MAVQTTYSENIGAARAGMIANEEPCVLISRNVETAAGIGFGAPVAQGTGDDGCKATEAGVMAILGITVRERSVRPETPSKFAQYESARIMTTGVIWVQAASAVTAGDIVTVTVATGALDNTAVAAGIIQIPNARWETSTTGAGLAKIRLG